MVAIGVAGATAAAAGYRRRRHRSQEPFES
jgi:hypothetical protein